MADPGVSPNLVERLFRRLVENLTALDPGALHRPVALADIPERLVPYRTHRTQLGFDTSEDYEMTVLRLLAGEGGFATTYPDDVREALVREAAAVNPDTALFRQFPDATVLLDPERAAEVVGATPPGLAQAAAGSAAAANGPMAPVGRDAPVTGPRDLEAIYIDPRAEADHQERDEESLPFTLDEAGDEPALPAARPREVAPVSAPCSYCGANLPIGRTVLFCPHCGQNVGVVHCPTCGSELDVGWQFCIACGLKVTGIG